MIKVKFAPVAAAVVAVLWGVSIATSVMADVRTINGKTYRCARVATAATGSINCDSGWRCAVSTFCATAVCFSPGATNSAYGSFNVCPDVTTLVRFTKGDGRVGPGITAPGDTSAFDSTIVTRTDGAGQITLNIKGMMMSDGTTSSTESIRKVLVYPDSNAANADPDFTGTGAIFNGTVQIYSGPLKPTPEVFFSGNFSSGDFSVQNPAARRVEVRPLVAGGLSKVVPIGTPANAVVVVYSHANPPPFLPASSRGMIMVLALMLGVSAFLVLRRREAQIA